jgi:hypothetical protein
MARMTRTRTTTTPKRRSRMMTSGMKIDAPAREIRPI